MSVGGSGNWLAMAGVAAVSALIGAGTVAAIGQMSPRPVAGSSRAAVERVVRDYILANPEIIPEANAVLRDRQTGEVIAANRSAIINPYGSAWIGNPDGDVTLVQYFDYNCGFCRSSLPTIAKLIESDPKIRIVFRELPILSDESRTAARLSLVAADKGRFRQFHEAVYAGGPITEASLGQAISAAGLDPATARAAAADPRHETEIRTNLAIAQQLGVTGTPSWVIGNRVISAALPLEELQREIARVRASR